MEQYTMEAFYLETIKRLVQENNDLLHLVVNLLRNQDKRVIQPQQPIQSPESPAKPPVDLYCDEKFDWQSYCNIRLFQDFDKEQVEPF